MVRIGYPFRNMIHYTVGDGGNKKRDSKINHDLYIESKDFKIEVKYIRNWSINGLDKHKSNKIQWAEIQKDFAWLEGEIEKGNAFDKELLETLREDIDDDYRYPIYYSDTDISYLSHRLIVMNYEIENQILRKQLEKYENA